MGLMRQGGTVGARPAGVRSNAMRPTFSLRQYSCNCTLLGTGMLCWGRACWGPACSAGVRRALVRVQGSPGAQVLVARLGAWHQQHGAAQPRAGAGPLLVLHSEELEHVVDPVVGQGGIRGSADAVRGGDTPASACALQGRAGGAWGAHQGDAGARQATPAAPKEASSPCLAIAHLRGPARGSCRIFLPPASMRRVSME